MKIIICIFINFFFLFCKVFGLAEQDLDDKLIYNVDTLFSIEFKKVVIDTHPFPIDYAAMFMQYVIDDSENIYILDVNTVQKFDRNGVIIWSHKRDSSTISMGYYNNKIYFFENYTVDAYTCDSFKHIESYVIQELKSNPIKVDDAALFIDKFLIIVNTIVKFKDNKVQLIRDRVKYIIDLETKNITKKTKKPMQNQEKGGEKKIKRNLMK